MTQMNISTKNNRFTDIENIFVVAKGVGGRKGKDWEFGISRCKPLYRNRKTTQSYCIAQRTIFNIL